MHNFGPKLTKYSKHGVTKAATGTGGGVRLYVSGEAFTGAT